MNNKIKVLTEAGTYISLEEWQKEYGISGDKIGRHFSYKEPKFQEDLKNYGELIVCAPLIRILDVYRDRKGSSVNINSFNRNRAKQLALIKQGFRAASVSPHEFFLAADCDTKTFEESRRDARLVIAIAKELNLPCRVGVEDYISKGQTFIHIDVCPMYFRPGKPFNKQKHHPAWEAVYSTW